MKRLTEKITQDYVDSIKKDCDVFFGNIKTIENAAQYKDLQERWRDYVNGYLRDKIGKSIFGIDTNRESKSKGVAEFKKFSKWAVDCMMVFQADSRDAGIEMTEDADAVAGRFADEMTPRITQPRLADAWQNLYDIFDKVRDDKADAVGKKTTAFFKNLSGFVNDGLGTFDKFVEDHVMIDGIRVDIEYADKVSFGFSSIDDSAYWFDDPSLKGTKEVDFMAKAINDVRRGISFIKSANFGSALKGLFLKLSTVDPMSKGKNIKGGKSYGTGGLYRISDGTITLLKGRLLTYSSWGVTEAIIHEVGHKFYFERMVNEQREEWRRFYRQLRDNDYQDYAMTALYDAAKRAGDLVRLDVQKLDQILLRISRDEMWHTSVVGKDNPDVVKFSDRDYFMKAIRRVTPPELQMFIKEFVKVPPSKMAEKVIVDAGHTIAGCFDKETGIVKAAAINFFADELSKYYVNMLDKRRAARELFPSEYGAEDPEEFFAETFLAYCLWKTEYGRNSLLLVEPVFEKFIDVTRVRGGLSERINRSPSRRIR